MNISLNRLFAQDGSTKTYQVSLDAESVTIADITYPIVEKSPVILNLTHEGNRVVTVKGETNLVLELPCARCLAPVKTPFHLEFDRKLHFGDSGEEEEEDSLLMDGESLCVEELVRNELIIQWPIRVLCKEDCKGICSRCGANLNIQSCGCDTTVPDPRMAAMKDIFSKFKEV